MNDRKRHSGSEIERLAGDGLSEFHPAFMQLAPILQGCARSQAQYCRCKRPRDKPARKPGLGSGILQRDAGTGGEAQAGQWGQGQRLGCEAVTVIA